MKFSGRFHQQVCAHLTFTVIIVFMILQTRRSSSKFHPYLFVRNNCGCCEKKKKTKITIETSKVQLLEAVTSPRSIVLLTNR